MGRLLDGGALNRIIIYVTALMEVKSSMGVIVAAPTAGACAALPGAVIATRWTFAAEVDGCQAEGGAAASMAFQSMLGLICDPIANRVEAPCLGKIDGGQQRAFVCEHGAGWLRSADPAG
ncbi:MAG: L-serine ammonia-lyase, iron-sulfur-dependent, subunit alpha [Verrucomicrobiaceae bacterium]|nr:L-serine ammonia-lyase, iron-sulfur-dependent, subunit alpha [Verrucomicrobiaceae bacterium]